MALFGFSPFVIFKQKEKHQSVWLYASGSPNRSVLRYLYLFQSVPGPRLTEIDRLNAKTRLAGRLSLSSCSFADCRQRTRQLTGRQRRPLLAVSLLQSSLAVLIKANQCLWYQHS